MLNTLHIQRSAETAAGDNLGGYRQGVHYNGLRPWIEADTLNCVAVQSVSGICRWSIEGTAAGLYRLTNLDTADVGEWTACALYETVTLYAQSTGDYGLYVGISVDRAATAGTLTGRTIREQNLPERAASAAGYKYRCVYLYATGAVNISAVTATGCTYATGTGAQPSTDGSTAPEGVTITGTTGAVDIDVAQNGEIALWARVPTTATAGQTMASITLTYTSGAHENSVTLYFAWMQYSTALSGYRLYVDETATVGGTDLETLYPSLPIAIVIEPPLAANFRVSKINKYGLQSECRYLGIKVDVAVDGSDLNVPATPTDVTAICGTGGIIAVAAKWTPTEGQFRLLTGWKVKYSSPLVAETVFDVSAQAVSADGYYTLATTLPTGAWGDVYSVDVAVVSLATTSAYAASADATITTAAAELGAFTVKQASTLSSGGATTSAEDYFTIYSYPGNVAFVNSGGGYWWQAMAGTTRGINFEGRYLSNAYDYGTSGADPDLAYELAGSSLILCAGGNYVAEIDATTVYCASFKVLAEADNCPLPGPYVITATDVYWQIFDLTRNRWQTYMRVSDDGSIYLGIGVRQWL